MSFGKELKMKCNENLEKDIYEKLKLILLECANEREKGCKINFSGIDEIVITALFQLLKKDEIEVIENHIPIWDNTAIESKLVRSPDPCSVCHFTGLEKWTCCGCPEKMEWDKKNEIDVKGNYILIWDNTAIESKLVRSPDPCSVCHFTEPEKWTCCGCSEKMEWDKKNEKEEKTICNVSSLVTVSYSNNQIEINVIKED